MVWYFSDRIAFSTASKLIQQILEIIQDLGSLYAVQFTTTLPNLKCWNALDAICPHELQSTIPAVSINFAEYCLAVKFFRKRIENGNSLGARSAVALLKIHDDR